MLSEKKMLLNLPSEAELNLRGVARWIELQENFVKCG